MYLFRKKHSLEQSQLFTGMTDYHSHLLPGVDDGVQTLDESISVLKEYERLGLKRLYLTPHFMEKYRENRAETILAKFNEYKASYTGNIDLRIGGEYMLDFSFQDRIEKEPPLTIDDHLLLEIPLLRDLGEYLKFYLYKIQLRGYDILLAHPERYLSLHIKEYQRLQLSGIRFQLDLFSLTGLYGRAAKENAQYLLDNDFYNCIGSDVHGYTSFVNCIKVKAFSLKDIARLEAIKV